MTPCNLLYLNSYLGHTIFKTPFIVLDFWNQCWILILWLYIALTVLCFHRKTPLLPKQGQIPGSPFALLELEKLWALSTSLPFLTLSQFSARMILLMHCFCTVLFTVILFWFSYSSAILYYFLVLESAKLAIFLVLPLLPEGAHD